MNSAEKPHKTPWTLWLALIGSLLGGIFLLLFIRKRKVSKTVSQIFPQKPDLAQYNGLSKDAAEAARRTDYEPYIEQHRKALRKAILRRNVVSIFNLSLVGLSIAQLSLQDPLGALITFGTLLLNISVNSFQELFSIRRVSELRAQTKQLTTAIRDGRLEGIPNEDVVIGDVLLVDVGGEFPAEGQLLSCSNLQIYDPDNSTPQAIDVGAIIHAGSQCLHGWGVYRVQELSPLAKDDQLIEAQDTDFRMTMTPIQRVIDRILRIMLGIVIIFLVILAGYIFINVTVLADSIDELLESILLAVNLPSNTIPPTSEIIDLFYGWIRTSVGLIFSLAPSGLFFMVVVSYAVGVADLGKFGAMVRRTYVVESLAQVTVLCISKGASLSGADIQMDLIPWEDNRPSLPANYIKQVLGSFARSQRSSDFFLRAISDNFDGEIRKPQMEFYYLQTFGWGGVNFSDIDLTGTFVLGHPGLLAQNLLKQENANQAQDSEDEKEGIVHRVSKPFQRTFSSVRSLFKKAKSEDELAQEANHQIQSADVAGETSTNNNNGSSKTEASSGAKKIFGRFRKYFNQKKEQDTEQGISDTLAAPAQVELLFAYTPNLQPLFDTDGNPNLPRELIPLSNLVFVEQMRPEAKQVVKSYRDAGVNVKILANDGFDRVEQLGLQLGWDVDDITKIVSGAQLETMTDQNISDEISSINLFCELDSLQKERLVCALKDRGEFVAFVGDRADDERAINQAHVGISSLYSFRSVLAHSDIVMLKDSIEALTPVFQKGQRIVNGLFNVLNINLVQVIYILLLLVAFFLSPPAPFYYDPTQGGMIVFFTLVLPNIGLTIWAPKGSAPRDRLTRRLARFVLPAALTMTIAGLVVFNVVRASGWTIITAQLAVTHTFVAMGLLLVLFAQPPSTFWVGGNRLSGDRRITIMVVTILILWAVLISIPLSWELLRVRWLDSFWINGMIVVVLVIWTFLLRTLWRIRRLNNLYGLSDVLDN